MASVVSLDASPITVLRSMRGPIVAAQIAYPDVLHLEIRDSEGKLWRFATQDAEWSPAEPDDLIGRSVESAEIDSTTGDLRCGLSGGGFFAVIPGAAEATDDPPNWELLSPNGFALEFGPGFRWQISPSDVPISSPR